MSVFVYRSCSRFRVAMGSFYFYFLLLLFFIIIIKKTTLLIVCHVVG